MTNTILTWSQLHEYEVMIKNKSNEDVVIILSSKRKPDVEINIEYDIHQYDESLNIDYQNYRFMGRECGKIQIQIELLPLVLKALIAGNYQIIIEHYYDKLIDSKLKIIANQNEIVFFNKASTLISNSRFRKFLN